jgi:hypothetical protein
MRRLQIVGGAGARLVRIRALTLSDEQQRNGDGRPHRGCSRASPADRDAGTLLAADAGMLSCPRCDHEIPASQINVASDVAVCRDCDHAFVLSDQLRAGPAAPPIALPPGAWLEELPDGFRAGASTRSSTAWLFVPLMILWSTVMLLGDFGHKQPHPRTSPFFILMFVTVGGSFWTAALMALAGRCAIAVRGDDAELFVGIGALGLRRRFRWSQVRAIREVPSSLRYPGGAASSLCIEGATSLTFGSGLSDTRRAFLLHALRRHLRRAPAPTLGPFR